MDTRRGRPIDERFVRQLIDTLNAQRLVSGHNVRLRQTPNGTIVESVGRRARGGGSGVAIQRLQVTATKPATYTATPPVTTNPVRWVTYGLVNELIPTGLDQAYEVTGTLLYFHLHVNLDTSTGDPTSVAIETGATLPTDAADPGNGDFPAYLHFLLGVAYGDDYVAPNEAFNGLVTNTGGGDFTFTSVASDLVVGVSNNYIRKKLFFIRS